MLTRELDRALGRFRITQKIGAGGMAVVYRAFDEQRQSHVALKVLRSERTADPEVVSRFKREAEIASALHHPHIVPVYEYGEIQGHLYMIMPYMPHGSLARYFERPARISLGTVARLLWQIAKGLDYAHSQGVVHRDLKLENVLLDEQNRPVLTDFGLARLMDGARLTMTGHVTGTPLYMSPEQVRGETVLDFRSDLYSLAVMAYLLATGKFPFSGTVPYVILNHHLHRVPPTPSTVNPALPPSLNPVLFKGLAKRPEDRFASAGAFAQAFAEAISVAATSKTLILGAESTVILGEEAEDRQLRSSANTVRFDQKPSRRGRKVLLAASVLLATGVLAATQRLSSARAPSPVVSEHGRSPGFSADARLTVPLTVRQEQSLDSGAGARISHPARVRVTSRSLLLPTATEVITPTATPVPAANSAPLPQTPVPPAPTPGPGHSDNPPGQGNSPPGQDKAPPDHGSPPSGQGNAPPSQDRKP